MSTTSHSLARTVTLHEAFSVACKATGPLSVRARHRGTGAEQEYPLHEPFAVLGRWQGASVQLDDPSVSRGHAYVQVIDGALYCVDLGSRMGVLWPDGAQGRGWVAPGQPLQVGAFDVTFEGPFEPPFAHDPMAEHGGFSLSPAAIEVHYPDSQHPAGLHLLDRPLILVGRNPRCELRLLHDSVGYFQCSLVNTPDGVWIVDLLSRQGTVLNGRFSRLARVRNGDLIEIGRVSLLVRTGIDSSSSLSVASPTAGGAGDPMAVVAKTVAEAVAGVALPIGDMMRQFQQCVASMAELFATTQREQAAIQAEQMAQIRALAAEVRELRGAASPPLQVTTSVAPAAPSGAVPPPPNPMPSAPGNDSPALSGAHTWFMDRLASKGHSGPPV